MSNKKNPITKIRENLDLTKKELAVKLEVSRQSVHNWENRGIKPNQESISKIADMLEVPRNYLSGAIQSWYRQRGRKK